MPPHDRAAPGLVAAWVAVALLAGPLACIQAPVEVQTFDPQRADLGAIRSFAPIPPPWPHPLAGADVEQEIRDALLAKGLTLAPESEADMLVAYRGVGIEKSRRRTQVDAESQYTVEEEYIEGTLEIDMFDPADRQVIWRGVGQIDIFSAGAIPAAARKAVRAILAEWPPEAPAQP